MLELVLGIAGAMLFLIMCVLISRDKTPEEDDEQVDYLKEYERKRNLNKR